jgi:hypothetical protein
MSGLHGKQSLRSVPSLFNAYVIKWNVDLSLMTVLGIPNSLTVAP